MNFYVRYMDMHNTEIIDIDTQNNEGVVNKLFGTPTETLLGKIYTVNNAKFGPTNYAGGIISNFVGTSSPSVLYYQGRIVGRDPDDYGPTLQSEWTTYGWDMTSIANHKDELTNYYIESMNTGSLESYYQAIFGADFQDLDYNLVIYWGYPMQDGVVTGDLMAFNDIYIGNDPARDLVVAG